MNLQFLYPMWAGIAFQFMFNLFAVSQLGGGWFHDWIYSTGCERAWTCDGKLVMVCVWTMVAVMTIVLLVKRIRS